MMTTFHRMPQRPVVPYAVVVAPTFPELVQIVGLQEVADDALGRSFGDALPLGLVAQSDPRVPGDARQRMGTVGQKRPFVRAGSAVPACDDRKLAAQVGVG